MRRHAALVMLAWLAFGAFYLRHMGGDVSRFVVAGDLFTDPARAPKSLSVWPNDGGYDGQFYYRLAIAPLSTDAVAAGVRFDYPIYRQQRILFPLAVHLLSLGKPALVLWAFPILNVVLLGVLCVLAMKLAGSPWAFAAAFAPSFVFTFTRNLTEIAAVTLIVAALIALHERKHGAATLLLSLAVLTKETTLVVAISLGVAWAIAFVRRHELPARLDTIVVPAVVHFGWKLIVAARWDLPFSLGTSGVIGTPFSGFLSAAIRANRLQLLELAAIVALFALTLFALRAASRELRIGWIGYSVFVALLAPPIWVEDVAYLRALAEWWVLSVLIAASGRTRIPVTAITLVVCTAAALRNL